MIRAAATSAIALALAGCGGRAVKPVPDPLPPVAIRCAPMAYEACQTQPPRWDPPDAESPEAWKLLVPQVLQPMARELRDCDARLRAVQACLDEAQRQRVLVWR